MSRKALVSKSFEEMERLFQAKMREIEGMTNEELLMNAVVAYRRFDDMYRRMEMDGANDAHADFEMYKHETLKRMGDKFILKQIKLDPKSKEEQGGK